MQKALGIAGVLFTMTTAGCGAPSSTPEPAPSAIEHLVPEIVATHPFDSASFTQGLEMDGEDLIVGTGWYNESRVYRGPVGGAPVVQEKLPSAQFGEGITLADGHIWQLTWKDGVAYKRDPHTLVEVDRAHFSGEGWGLCSTPDHVVMSDGTATLRFLDRDTFAEQKRVEVHDESGAIDRLNELECVGNEVYANRFMTTDIYRIDSTGRVSALIDASSLPNRAAPDPNNVLNGIAAIPGTDRFLLTGKRWPDLYEVRFVPAT